MKIWLILPVNTSLYVSSNHVVIIPGEGVIPAKLVWARICSLCRLLAAGGGSSSIDTLHCIHFVTSSKYQYF